MLKKLYTRSLKKLTFHYKNSEVRIKKTGVLFLLFIVLVGAIAINSGNNLVYLTFTTILSFLVLSGLLSSYNLRYIEISIDNPDFVFAKKDTLFKVKIKNRSKMPKFFIQIELLNKKKFVPFVENYSIEDFVIQFPERGRRTISYVKIGSTFPFEFFERKKKIKVDFCVIIAPEIKKISFGKLQKLAGKKQAKHFYGEDEFYSIREYSEGEDARKISWPITAKAGKAMIIEKTEEMSNKIYLFIDNSRYTYNKEQQFENDLIKIASAMYASYIKGCEVALLSEKRFGFSKTAPQIKEMLEFLGTLELKNFPPINKPAVSIGPEDIHYA